MLERYTLKNGIPLFVVATQGTSVVSLQAWVTRGSIHEPASVAGISHFLEHAVFKGTRRRKVGEIAREIEARGGELNAFTSYEETAFYITLASRYFDDGLDVLSDMLQNAAFDPGEMKREQEVVLEEIKRAKDSPHKMASLNLWGASFAGTPFGRPVLGFDKTVRKITHKTLRDYFHNNYHAGTTSLFVVGDVEPLKVFDRMQRSFGGMRRKPAPKFRIPLRAPTRRRAEIIPLAKDLQECHLLIGISTPGITHSDIPALDLACSAIGQGESSRLFQRLIKEKQLALDVNFGLSATHHCGLMSLSLLAAPEKMYEALGEATALLDEVAATGLLPREIERVKSSMESDVVSGKETVEGYARRLGYYYCEFGDPEHESKYLQNVLSVDEETAGNVFSTYHQKAPVVSLVHPLSFKPDAAKVQKALQRKTVSRKRPALGTTHIGDVQVVPKTEFSFVYRRLSTLPLVSMRVIFAGGNREESASTQGVGNLLQRLWTAGTKSYNSYEISHQLESLGASLHGFCGRHTMGLGVELLTKQWGEIKPLLQEILAAPLVPEEEFRIEKDLITREILSEKDTPGQLCSLNFSKALYGNHSYGRSALGTQESIKGLTRESVLDFYGRFVRRGKVVVSTVGHAPGVDFWAKEWEELLSHLPKGAEAPAPRALTEAKTGLTIVSATKEPLFQSHVLVGFLGPHLFDPDRYALKLLSSCLAGQGGRLFLELRDKLSLAYQVSPMSSEGPDGGMFGFYIGCAPEKWERALSGIRLEIDKILQRPLMMKELQRAKEYWIGRFELDLQRYGVQSMVFGLDEFYGLGSKHAFQAPELVKSITAQKIQDAARKYLRPELATLSIVHPHPLTEVEVAQAWNGNVKPQLGTRMRRSGSPKETYVSQ